MVRLIYIPDQGQNRPSTVNFIKDQINYFQDFFENFIPANPYRII